MSDFVVLSEVLASGVGVEWQEAIAVVRSVAECMSVKPNRSASVPDLYQIRVSSSGEIDITGGTNTSEPVRRLGQLLQATIGQSEPPVKLRLIVSEAIAPTPAFASVQELDDALAYFERPDRRDVLRRLYERAAAAPSSTDPASAATLDTIAPLTPSGKEGSKAQPAETSATHRYRQLVVAVAFIMILGAVGFWKADENAGSPLVDAMGPAAERLVETTGGLIRTALSALSERVGFGRLVWSDTAVGKAPAAAAPSPTKPSSQESPAARGPQNLTTTTPQRTAPQRRALQRAAPPSSSLQPAAQPSSGPSDDILGFDLEPAPASVELPPATEPGQPPPSLALADPEDEKESVDLTTTYTLESEGIDPPIAVRPQLPTELPPGVRLEDLASIELVVLTDGTVESVQLVSAAHSVHDVMWLSAVKAWQFRPAMKEGRPVRYRKTVWIAYR